LERDRVWGQSGIDWRGTEYGDKGILIGEGQSMGQSDNDWRGTEYGDKGTLIGEGQSMGTKRQ